MEADPNLATAVHASQPRLLHLPPLVDSYTPRGKAAIHAALPALAFLVGPPVSGPAILVIGAIMGLSALAGPRFSLIGRLFNKVVRGVFRIGKGVPEPVAPHRFAEAVGAVFLVASGLAYLAERVGLGESLALIVVALALVNASLGLCVGCIIYNQGRRFSRVNSAKASDG